VSRLVPGVLGDEASSVDESHSCPGRLEYPHYTRPRVYRGLAVPEVLLSGDHAKIAAWRDEQSRLRSRTNEQPSPGLVSGRETSANSLAATNPGDLVRWTASGSTDGTTGEDRPPEAMPLCGKE
jgi:tRNA G37 N-methylase TrmD